MVPRLKGETVAVTSLEREMWRRYERITGVQPLGYSDVLHVLMGPDMIDLLEDVIAERKEAS